MAIISFNTFTTPVELSGELTQYSIMQITKKNIKNLFLSPSMTLDLAKITRIDTAGLAWLFYLLEQASIDSCELSFVNIPTKLEKLIRLSGVEGFLPVKQ
jgi:phospholipid transport system transporter-binding protein